MQQEQQQSTARLQRTFSARRFFFSPSKRHRQCPTMLPTYLIYCTNNQHNHTIRRAHTSRAQTLFMHFVQLHTLLLFFSVCTQLQQLIVAQQRHVHFAFVSCPFLLFRQHTIFRVVSLREKRAVSFAYYFRFSHFA